MGTVTDAESVPVRDVAATFRISERHVWRLLATGVLERVKVGRATRVSADSVRRLATPTQPTATQTA